MENSIWLWLAFLGIILALLVFDLGVLHRKDHEIGVRESLWLSLFYVVIASLFGAWVWYHLGAERGEEYFTGYFIEKSLALDNIFIISLFFKYFAIPKIYQHRVLFWGIIGVIVMRAIMIALGASIIQNFAWALYIFAVFLIITGIKMFKDRNKEYDIEHSKLLKFAQKHLRVTSELHGHQFFVYQKNSQGKRKLWITPLFLTLIFIEITDLVFAIDSVPAIFAITTDPYIVYTSNIFAILGLRALFFALNAIIHRFKYLKHALAFILIFIGSKIFIADLLGLEKFPASVSLAITFMLLLGGLIYSLIKTRDKRSF